MQNARKILKSQEAGGEEGMGGGVIGPSLMVPQDHPSYRGTRGCAVGHW